MNDYEKKYNDAMLRADEAVQKGCLDKNIFDIIFPPEESEDERIRKWLVELVENQEPKMFIEVKKMNVFAWLEKHKINTEGDFARGYDCGYESCLNSHGAEWYEKQKEQKPSITTKFKKGEKIRFKDGGKSYIIADIRGLYYIAEDGQRMDIPYTDENFVLANDEQKPVGWSEEDEKMKELKYDVLEERNCGDGTFIRNVRLNVPMTVRELIQYATYKSREWGYIEIEGKKVLEYRYGAVLTDNITDEQKARKISAMKLYGGYTRADYILELESVPDRSAHLQGYIDGRIAAEKEFAEKFGIVIPPKTPKK